MKITITKDQCETFIGIIAIIAALTVSISSLYFVTNGFQPLNPIADYKALSKVKEIYILSDFQILKKTENQKQLLGNTTKYIYLIEVRINGNLEKFLVFTEYKEPIEVTLYDLKGNQLAAGQRTEDIKELIIQKLRKELTEEKEKQLKEEIQEFLK